MMNLEDAIDIHDPRRLDHLTEAELDHLPVGTIRVDAEGRILFYSRAQSVLSQREVETVLGRNFFSEVAPCTVVPEFYGRFRRGVLTGHLETTFEFIFDFQMAPVRVRITMRAAERAGEFWIIVQPQDRLSPRNEQTAYDLIAGKFCEHIAAVSAASFDFSQCDLEPISTCGMIQPFGCLLVVDPVSQHIQACSANTEMYLGLTPELLLDAPLEQALPSAHATALYAALAADVATAHFVPSFFLARAPLDAHALSVRLHRWHERLLLEIEPYGEMEHDVRMRGFDIESFQRRLRASDEIKRVCQEAVDVLMCRRS